ncbi:MAG TPA: AAA family ATPase [Rhodocyclaceae bacterium]|nr:AAA family ATPase [Rhodocyclaceae bacterium]
MPIRLKGVLIEHGISVSTFAGEIKQARDIPLSRTALHQIINHSYYPKNTPRDSIQRQVEERLRERNIPEAELLRLWEPQGDDRHRHGMPVGASVGKAAPKPPGFKQRDTQQDEQPQIDPLEAEVLTPTAKRFFKLFRDPFSDDVNGPEDLFLGEDQRYIREAMLQTAKHGGFLAVVGESGAGKSVLRRDLVDRLHRDSAPVIVIFPQTVDKSRLTASSICQAIVDDLQPGAPLRTDPEAKARQVQKLLTDSSRAGNSHVLVIEEAHDLNVSTLKYLKRFWELEDGFKRLLSIILIGQPELKERLDERRNPGAREVIRRCEIAELLPLDLCLEDYLTHKFMRVQVGIYDVLDKDACDAIRLRLSRTKPGSREMISQVYPLVVNNLVTKAMNRAAAIGIPQVPGDLIKEL